jgi:hypothetical protein
VHLMLVLVHLLLQQPYLLALALHLLLLEGCQ